MTLKCVAGAALAVFAVACARQEPAEHAQNEPRPELSLPEARVPDFEVYAQGGVRPRLDLGVLRRLLPRASDGKHRERRTCDALQSHPQE